MFGFSFHQVSKVFFLGQQVAKVLSVDEVEIPCIKSWGNKKIRK